MIDKERVCKNCKDWYEEIFKSTDGSKIFKNGRYSCLNAETNEISRARIFTPPDFGCINFTPKEAE